MVNQSDIPFRLLVRRYNASLVYTQMLLPHRLLDDRDYFEFHTRGLHDTSGAQNAEFDAPVVVQLCGNDPETVVRAARMVAHKADAIGACLALALLDSGRKSREVDLDPRRCADLNLGCPQDAAREGHYGGYLLGQKDWPLVESIDLGARLEAAGASWLTLHARHVSARRRRQGAADLTQVRALKERVKIPVVSNGNVRTWEDVCANRETTGADGVMVGEALLANPCLFANVRPDPVQISLEYLDICLAHPGTATLQTMQMHIRHFVDDQCGRRPWFSKFRTTLGRCETIEEMEKLLRVKVQRWRGLEPLMESETGYVEDEADGDSENGESWGEHCEARVAETEVNEPDVDLGDAFAAMHISL